MAWIFLLLASLFEISWAVGLKYTAGFTRFWPSVATLAAIVMSMVFLGLAVRTLPIGTAYAIWTGLGAAGTVILGIIIFGESASLVRICCVLLILTGVLGLKLFSGSAP